MTRPSPDPAARLRFGSVALSIALSIWLTPIGCVSAAENASGSAEPATPALAAMPAGESGAGWQDPPHDRRVLTIDERTDIQWLTSILRNAANDQETRAGAALRLMSIGHTRALEPLIEALAGDDEGLKVAAAISELSDPPPELLDPAIEGLRSASGTTLDQLALALTRYGQSAYRKLRTIAHDQSLEPAPRHGAIVSLGTFRTRDATEALIRLLEPQREEEESIIAATCRALQHATGLPYGQRPAAWRSWWAEASDQPPELWLTNLVQRLSEQIAKAEQNIEREREATTRVQQRLAQAYRDLFPRLELEEQLQALPTLLDDPLPSIREFAVDRIARLLRDSVRIPEELQHKLAERINDERPALRLQSARLLEQMNYDQLAVRLGERLAMEEDDQLITGFLDILSKRPGAVAFPAVVPHLTSPQHGERAAIVLWEIVNHETVTEESLAELREVARAEDMPDSAAHVRLMARTMPDAELQPIVALMDSEENALKRAVAEGLMRRGAVQPLLDRVSDESIYPFAVRAVANSKDPWEAMRQLVTLVPPPAHEAVWREQLQHLITNLPAERLADADDLLAAASAATDEMRIQAMQSRLSPAENGNGNGLPAEIRTALTLRLAELLLRTDQPALALERLETIAGSEPMPDVTSLQFRAMLRLEHYDRANQIVSNPEEWVALLTRWVDDRPEQAVALREEIQRRFGGQLSDELQGRLEALTERLPLEPSGIAPGATDQPVDTGEA